jgi:hypothetical protein
MLLTQDEQVIIKIDLVEISMMEGSRDPVGDNRVHSPQCRAGTHLSTGSTHHLVVLPRIHRSKPAW